MIWVNRHKAELESGPEEARRRGRDPARGGEAARRQLGPGGRMRALALGSRGDRLRQPALADDVHGGPRRRRGVRDRLAGVPRRARGAAGLLEQAGFPVCGLLATHGDWDHLLGPPGLPGRVARVRRDDRARLSAEPGAAQRELREFDEQHYVAGRAPLALGGPGAAGPGPRARPSGARAAPGRRPHGRRHGV